MLTAIPHFESEGQRKTGQIFGPFGIRGVDLVRQPGLSPPVDAGRGGRWRRKSLCVNGLPHPRQKERWPALAGNAGDVLHVFPAWPRRTRDRMRKAVARDVRGGRERDVRGVARRWSRSGHRNTLLGSDGGQPHARQPLGNTCGPLIDGLAPLHHAETVAPLGIHVQLGGEFELLVGQVEHRRFGGV